MKKIKYTSLILIGGLTAQSAQSAVTAVGSYVGSGNPIPTSAPDPNIYGDVPFADTVARMFYNASNFASSTNQIDGGEGPLGGLVGFGGESPATTTPFIGETVAFSLGITPSQVTFTATGQTSGITISDIVSVDTTSVQAVSLTFQGDMAGPASYSVSNFSFDGVSASIPQCLVSRDTVGPSGYLGLALEAAGSSTITWNADFTDHVGDARTYITLLNDPYDMSGLSALGDHVPEPTSLGLVMISILGVCFLKKRNH